MTKYPASDKTASFGKKPHIKKGYYPAQLLKVQEFKDKDGKLKEGKFGRQLIFDFAIYKANPETGEPVEPMTYVSDPESERVVQEDVVIAKFVYHQYKSRESGEFMTAITPNSAITKILKALGWEFSAEGVDIEPLIGHWVEVNVDDYDAEDGDEKYKASGIKDINKYEGPIPEGLREATQKEPKKIEKQLKHEAVKSAPATQEEIDIENKKKELMKLRDEGLLTEEGLKMAIEQLDSKLEEMRRGKK